MSILDSFKRRKQKAKMAGKPVVYTYDSLPEGFRNHVLLLLQEALGVPPLKDPPFGSVPAKENWFVVHREMLKLEGVQTLADQPTPYRDCLAYLLVSQDTDSVLSLIEFAFSLENGVIDSKAVEELNHRFREHQLGYQYRDGQIIQMDSDYLHTEAVEPALSLLAEPGFEGPCEEFLTAHKHYREGNHRDAMNQALNAFESTMKVICDDRGTPYDHKATASKLIDKLFDDDFLPTELQSEFTSLRGVLESGVPTMRNRKSGHGQGAKVVDVPDYLASYALHLTASNIVFLVEAHRANR